MISQALKEGTLPASMAEAIIVVVPKPGKDPEVYASYRPISLLNVDAKILTKVLVRRLNKVFITLIYEDQMGFMPGKGTDINLRRLYTVLASTDFLTQFDAVASLDAEKAFDLVWCNGITFGRSCVILTLALNSSPGCRPYTDLRGLEWVLGGLFPHPSIFKGEPDRVALCRQPSLH